MEARNEQDEEICANESTESEPHFVPDLTLSDEPNTA
jgi:hypothetical protein